MRRRRLAFLPILPLAATILACSRIPFLQPTATPTSTPTSTPTPTPTATPTPRPTPTPLPTATLAASQNTRMLPDGSTEFTDPQIGYRLVLPPGWLVLDLEAGDVEQALEEAAGLNPQFSGLIESFGTMLAQGMRLMALRLDPQALAAGYPPNVVLIAPEGLSSMGLTLEFLLETTALSIEGIFPGAELISYEMIEDPNGAPLGRLDMRMPVTTFTGETATVRGTWLLALAGDQLIELTLQAEDSLYAQAQAEMEQIVDSFELIGE